MMENNGKDDEDIYVQVETEISNHVTSRKFRVTHRKIHYDVAIRRDDVTSGIKEVVHMITGIPPKRQQIKCIEGEDSKKNGHSKGNIQYSVSYSKSVPDDKDSASADSNLPRDCDVATMFDKFRGKKKVDIKKNVSNHVSNDDHQDEGGRRDKKQIVKSKSSHKKDFIPDGNKTQHRAKLFDIFKGKKKVDINENLSDPVSNDDPQDEENRRRVEQQNLKSNVKNKEDFAVAEEHEMTPRDSIPEGNRLVNLETPLSGEEMITQVPASKEENTLQGSLYPLEYSNQDPRKVLCDDEMEACKLPEDYSLSHTENKDSEHHPDDEKNMNDDSSSSEHSEHKTITEYCKIPVLDISDHEVIVTADNSSKQDVDVALIDDLSCQASSESTPPPVHKSIQKLKRSLRRKKRRWFRNKKGDHRARDRGKEESTSTDECTRNLSVTSSISLEDDGDKDSDAGPGGTKYEDNVFVKEDDSGVCTPDAPAKEYQCDGDLGDATQRRRCRSDGDFVSKKVEDPENPGEGCQSAKDATIIAFSHLTENEDSILKCLRNTDHTASDLEANKDNLREDDQIMKNKPGDLNEDNSDSSSGISVSFDNARSSPTGASETSADTGFETGSLASESDKISSSLDVAEEHETINEDDEEVNKFEAQRSTDDVTNTIPKKVEVAESSEKRGKIHRKLKKEIFGVTKPQEKCEKRNENAGDKMKFWKRNREELKKMLKFFQKHSDSESDDSDWSDDDVTSSSHTSDEETSSVTSQRTITPTVVKRKNISQMLQAKKKPQERENLQPRTKKAPVELKNKIKQQAVPEEYKIIQRADKSVIPRYNYKDPRARHLTEEEDLSKYKEIVTLNSARHQVDKRTIPRSIVKQRRVKVDANLTSHCETNNMMAGPTNQPRNTNSQALLDKKRMFSADHYSINHFQHGQSHPHRKPIYPGQFPVHWIPSSRDQYEPIRSPGYDSNRAREAEYYDSNFHLISETFHRNPNPQRYLSDHIPPPRRYYPPQHEVQNPYNYTRQGSPYDCYEEEGLYDGYYSSRKPIPNPNYRDNFCNSELYSDTKYLPKRDRCYEQQRYTSEFDSEVYSHTQHLPVRDRRHEQRPSTYASDKNEDDYIVNMARMLRNGDHDQDCVAILDLSSKLFELASAFEWKDVYQIFNDLMTTSRTSNPGSSNQSRCHYVSQLLDQEVRNALTNQSVNFNERQSRRLLVPICDREVAKTTLKYPNDVLKVSCPTLLCKEFNTTGFCRRRESGLRCEYLHSCRNCAIKKNRNLPHPDIECENVQ